MRNTLKCLVLSYLLILTSCGSMFSRGMKPLNKSGLKIGSLDVQVQADALSRRSSGEELKLTLERGLKGALEKRYKLYESGGELEVEVLLNKFSLWKDASSFSGRGLTDKKNRGEANVVLRQEGREVGGFPVLVSYLDPHEYEQGMEPQDTELTERLVTRISAHIAGYRSAKFDLSSTRQAEPDVPVEVPVEVPDEIVLEEPATLLEKPTAATVITPVEPESPVVKEPRAEPASKVAKQSCTVEQILEMQRLGLRKQQIEAACE